jgi:AbrB family looped-hinge helix DNA binding protein
MGEWIKISENGRVLIPAEVRKQLGLVAGATLVLDVTPEGGLQLEPLKTRVARAQNALKDFAPGRSMVDELIAERRAEAAQEDAETAAWLAKRHVQVKAAE